MQPIFGSLLTIAKGKSIIKETIFENRFKYALELEKMGAKINQNENIIFIKGKRNLKNATVKATDLRGGMALILAGLSTKGETIVENAQYILRGYENLEKKLLALGADIKMI